VLVTRKAADVRGLTAHVDEMHASGSIAVAIRHARWRRGARVAARVIAPIAWTNRP
jgi:hypothetical protein